MCKGFLSSLSKEKEEVEWLMDSKVYPKVKVQGRIYLRHWSFTSGTGLTQVCQGHPAISSTPSPDVGDFTNHEAAL